MTDKKDAKEITNDMLFADIMLRLASMEKLLLDKKVFSQEELVKVTEEIATKVSKIILEKAQSSKNIEEFILDLENSSKNLKN